MSRKRTFDQTMAGKPITTSPYMPMFEQFRAELDEHHDRRERTIKASRDITAASKKIIFALQRARTLGQPLPPNIRNGTKPHFEIINKQYTTIAPELQGINAYRYSGQITGGNQEYMEAVIFMHYLENQSLITHQASQDMINGMCGGSSINLSVEDYILGVYDMTGEVMRFAITTMAFIGQLPGKENGENVLDDLRQLRAVLEGLDVGYGNRFAKDVGSKMVVMQSSVEKVEKALYSLVVRGSERPKGWLPDTNDAPNREEVESY